MSNGHAITIYPIVVDQTASSGAWSFNSLHISQGVITHIVIISATASTTFDISITDEYDVIIFNTATENGDGQQYGTPTGRLDRRVHIPVRGLYTITCATASVDEAFTGRIMVEQ